MRLLHIHFGKDGGAERFFVKLAGALHRRGVEQAAFIRPGRPWRKELPSALRVIEGVPRLHTLPWHAWRRDRLIRDFRPDGMLAWMPRAAAFLPRRSAVTRVVRLGDYPDRLGPFARTDALVCNTPGILEHVRALGWDRPVQVISNFSPETADRPAPRSSFGTPAQAFLVVGVGRLVPRKGFDSLIRAVARLEGVHLWLVGDGGEEGALKSLAEQLGLADRVRFLGWQDRPGPFIAAADVFALPSTHEPLGNGILEAWALSRPVVAAASEGPRWVVADGVDGLLHAPGDVPALTAALRRVRDEPGLAGRVGAAGRRSLDARFSEEAVCADYLRLFSARP
ncbi:MAG: glycosyltransferase [Opitutia bacterium]